jgi:site-specific DNA-methyltransferase (adenine-specific)
LKREIILGDCLAELAKLSAGSVDLIATDLPYGTTQAPWDFIIDPLKMWPLVWQVLKPGGAFITTASQPFTSALVTSQIKYYRHHLIWHKTKGGNFLDAKRRPMKRHEDILVFCRKGYPTYNPQMDEGKPYTAKNGSKTSLVGDFQNGWVTENTGTRYPSTVWFVPSVSSKGRHPTEKPSPLYEKIINTYSNPGELVLDFTCGSGTTAEAAINTGRQFICIDNDPASIEVTRVRVQQELAKLYQVDNIDQAVINVDTFRR